MCESRRFWTCVTLVCCWPLETTSAPQPEVSDAGNVPFYLYDAPAFYSPSCLSANKVIDIEIELSNSGAAYIFFYAEFLRQLAIHPWRVVAPEEAEIFVVPFDVDLSSYHGELSLQCEGATHRDRLARVLAELSTSPWYQRNGGADHFWGLGSWRLWLPSNKIFAYIPVDEMHFIQNMTIGRYMDTRLYNLTLAEDTAYPRLKNLLDKAYNPNVVRAELLRIMQETEHNGGTGRRLGAARENYGHVNWRWWERRVDHWRCTIAMPPLTNPSIGFVESTYEAWAARPVSLYFRGKDRECWDALAAQTRARTIEALEHKILGAIIERGHAEHDYTEEVKAARFCLVIGCDDPQTSRFIDALAAGCMPVVVDSGFRLTVAPFSQLINYDAFTMEIPEDLWRADPLFAVRYVLEESETRLRKRYQALLYHRKFLLWNAPDSRVAEMTLLDVRDRCIPPGLDRH